MIEAFFEQFELLADAPNGVQKLRELILQLAVQGKLVSQDPNDETASVLLKKLRKEKEKILKEEKIKQADPLPISKANELYILPETWQWVRLGDVALILMGNSPPGSTYNTTGEGMPLINGPVEFGSTPFSETVINQYTTAPTKICSKGDLLLCVRGSTTGRTNIAGFEACIGRGVAAIRAFTYQRYVNYFVLASRQEIYKAGTGSTFPSVSFDRINNFLLPLPPLEEQKRIVDKVDRLMEMCDRLEEQQTKRRESCIRLNEGAIAQLLSASNAEESDRHWQRICNNFDLFYSLPENIGKLRQAILELAIRGKLVPQLNGNSIGDNDDEPHSISQSLPSGWAITELKNLVEVVSGNAFKSTDFQQEGTIKVIKITNVGVNEFVSTEEYLPSNFRDKFSQYIVNTGDILIALTRPYISQGLKVCICPATYNSSLLNQRVAALKKTSSNLCVQYLYIYLRSNSVLSYIREASRTMNQPNLSIKDLKNLSVFLPPIAEQNYIVEKVERLMKLCDELEVKLKDSYSHQEKLMEVAALQLIASYSENSSSLLSLKS